MTLDIRDQIIQQHAPMVMAPNYGALEPLEANGHRYLATRNGILLEARRPWLHIKWPMHEQGAVDRLPYGEVAQGVRVSFKLQRELLQRFHDDALKVAPFEHAAWLVWDDNAKALTYRELDIQEFSQGSVRYNRPSLAEHESLAVDMHSHGALGAFFSGTDDADDCGEVKVAVVLGDLAVGQKPSWAVRLCVLGLYIEMPGPKDL